MRAAWRAGRRRLRRGPFLAVIGIGWILYGHATVSDPRYSVSRSLTTITQYVSMGALGWMWVVCGIVALLAGLAGNRCASVQGLGFAALAVPATLWGACFTESATSGAYPSAAGSAAAWTAFAIGILFVSGMADPPPRRMEVRE